MPHLNEEGLEQVVQKILAALGKKVDKEAEKGLSTNDFSDTYKEKLNGIAEGANKTIVDNNLSETSDYPLANRIITEEFKKINNTLSIVGPEEGEQRFLITRKKGTQIQHRTGENLGITISAKISPTLEGFYNGTVSHSHFNKLIFEQGGINSSTGMDFESTSTIRTSFISVTPGTHYYIERTKNGGALGVRCYSKDKTFLGTGKTMIKLIQGEGNANNENPLSSSTFRAIFKPKDEVYFIRFHDYTNDLANEYWLEEKEKEDTVLKLSPLKEYSINLEEPLYGGEIDFCAGIITKTYDIIENYQGEELPGKWICDQENYNENTDPRPGSRVVYELAEPIDIPATPHRIRAFEGVNYIKTSSFENLIVDFNRDTYCPPLW